VITGCGCDVCARKEGRQEEAEADGGHGVGQQEDKDQGRAGERQNLAVL
jgi:hypothetical protein